MRFITIARRARARNRSLISARTPRHRANSRLISRYRGERASRIAESRREFHAGSVIFGDRASIIGTRVIGDLFRIFFTRRFTLFFFANYCGLTNVETRRPNRLQQS